MEKYICPMHPEITSEKPTRCTKCGMKLVPAAKVSHHISNHHSADKVGFKEYQPLIVVISVILLTSFIISLSQGGLGFISFKPFISNFMIGFFLTFSAFKLMDLSGFAQGYSTYDLLAMRWFEYGYIYPFIELFFGLVMIIIGDSVPLLWAEVGVMIFSGLGVLIKLLKKEKFQCACLGTFLKVPLTKVTLVEDFGMAFLAFLLLIL